MHDGIICELKNSKYYTISLDSTPNISNVDRLTLIVRYVLPTGPVEKFIKFLDMYSHNAEHLQDKLLTFLNENGIDIANCRDQSYDNASNMSGGCNGLQAKIKQLNEFAEYFTCFAHSLNLVGKCAAECCEEAKIFFAFVENIFTVFLHPPIAGVCLRLLSLMSIKPSQRNIRRIPGGRLAQIPLKHFFQVIL